MQEQLLCSLCGLYFFFPFLFFKGEVMEPKLSFPAPYFPLPGSLSQCLIGSDWTTRWRCHYQVQAPSNAAQNKSHVSFKITVLLCLLNSKKCYINGVTLSKSLGLQKDWKLYEWKLLKIAKHTYFGLSKRISVFHILIQESNLQKHESFSSEVRPA